MQSEWTPEPYNPYAPTPPPPPGQKKARSNAGLIAAAIFLIVAGLLLISTYFIQSEIEGHATKLVRKALAATSAVADIDFSKVKISLWRQRVDIHDVQVRLRSSGETLVMKRASFGGIDWATLQEIVTTRKAAVPKTFNIQFDGVKLPAGLVGSQANEFLKGLGYADLAFNSYIQIARDPERKTFDLEKLAFQIDDLGELDLSLSVGNLTLPSPQQFAEIKKDPKRFLAGTGDITKLTLRGFEIAFHDNSLVERGSQAFIAMGEASPISLVDLAIEANQPNLQKRDVASARAATDFTLPALKTLKAFLQKPDSITLASRPKKPIPIVSVLDDSSGGSINDLAHRLSLVVE